VEQARQQELLKLLLAPSMPEPESPKAEPRQSEQTRKKLDSLESGEAQQMKREDLLQARKEALIIEQICEETKKPRRRSLK
jgi:hypothetical protein